MLTHLGNKATCKLLEIFNHSWSTDTLPQTWREATMIPILKKGKDPKQTASYRPISLTSLVGKTMERVVNQRLKWYLETNDLLTPEHAGFRQFRATEDQITYLAQEIEELPTRDMDTRLYRWFLNQGNYRRRRWYHHPVYQWCNTDCQFCHRKALYQL